jgi:hypothetical protein
MSSRIARWPALLSLALLGSAAATDALAQDQPPLRISDRTLPEGNGGAVVAVFRVFQDGVRDWGSSTVVVSTGGGTATAGTSCGAPGVDYVGINGLTLAIDATRKAVDFNVTVCGDTRDEPDETFFLNLSNAIGAPIEDPQAQVTLTDDDPAPSLRINDVTVAEGTGGAVTTAVFTVTVTGASQYPLSVRYATANGSAFGGSCGSTNAEANADPRPTADYAATSGTLSFAPNQSGQTLTSVTTVGTTRDIRVPICSNDSINAIETFTVTLSNPVNATIARAVGVGTIR